MADVAFRVKPAFGANVGNKSINARPAIGQPTGPRGIPCSVLCPPDPPPDDEVPVTPPHTQPDKPVGATAAPEKQQEPAMSDIRKLS